VRAHSTHGRDEIHITFLLENLKGRPLEDLCVDRKITLDWILGKLGEKGRTGCIWLRRETNDGIL
jgi:hypothetical protein